MLGYESKLDELAVTVSTIKSVLLDAESKHQELSNEGRNYIDRLKEAVYDVDDLLDEFNTVVQREKMKKGGKVFKKVRQFFSQSNYFLVAFNMSREIKKLMNKLDKIAKDHGQFGLSDVHVPLKRRNATFSYTSDNYIIGRESDKESIVTMLLGDSDSMNDVGCDISFVSIIGVGGLGKTALAQFVYNDCRIEETFEYRSWVCVSEDFSLENIFRQMLGKNGSQIEELQRDFRKLIEGKKYLLVLDDVWSENRDEWDKLKVFLDLGRKGSRILVTSRSRKVARVLEDHLMYELKGLSEDDSWDLFKKFAFRKGQEPMNNDDHLFDISKEIFKKCANVPLALRVVGSMLYEQDESKWLSLETANLANIGQGEEGIIPILKFSYYELSSALKSCFSYCALFPKDHVIEKEKLIRLWLVHGCLDQPDDCRNEEDIGEEYFCTLVNRCFLQDVIMDEYGEIICCKMHDLIHDLAQEVAGHETAMLDSRAAKLDRRCRHLSLMRDGFTHFGGCRWSEMKKLRTFLHFTDWGVLNPIKSDVTAICSHFKRLRVLDLSYSDLITLPDEVGNLSHLRYLDLSVNSKLSILPNSITKLYNLQVLNLNNTSARKLPWNMKKLVNLRHLLLPYGLGMPKGMDSLTCLRTLNTFTVENETSKQVNICKLRDLKALVNLRGELAIIFQSHSSCDVANYRDVELIRALQLKKLCIHSEGQGSTSIPETLLGSLQPHNKLKGITITRLEILPSMSQLRHLKCLVLEYMLNVEFMEGSVIAGPSHDELIFFPSLEKLTLIGFPKLKGWWKEEISRVTGEVGSSSMAVPSFPSLLELILIDCPSLATFPSCPKLFDLDLYKCHRTLTTFENKALSGHPTTGDSSSLSSSFPLLYLARVTMKDIGMLDSLFGESLGVIHIQYFEGESLSTFMEKCVEPTSSIESLQISECPNLMSLSGVAKHFTSLQNLYILGCKNLELENNEEATMTTLKSLLLCSLPKLVNLPVEFQYLTTLQCMWINYCENLESLPEWINCLTSLQTLVIHRCHKLKSLPEAISRMPALQALYISDCDNLKRRCRQPDGEDWPNVRHIPRLYFSK
ncbi:putative disease resistance protein RGA1 isoform X2 [Silene latifolia]|uniref:putative disease resistance protein RGA1 isoform X2 n=1 Tax=Silene latifolia TaxID=37657 RepID=UPI003D776F55